MNIVDMKTKIRCDMPNCKNLADVKVDNGGFFRNAGLNFCNNCINDLYLTIAKRIVPKSPDNMLNKRIRTKKGELNEN